MTVERRFSNLFPTGEGAPRLRGRPCAARRSERACRSGRAASPTRGRPGLAVLTVLTGNAAEIDSFAAELHDGTRLEPLG